MALNLDLNQLMQDPNFVSGIGLLGGSSQRNQPLIAAYQMLQQMQRSKREQSEADQMAEYRRAQTEVARANATRYGEQVEAQKRAAERQEKLHQSGMLMLQQLGFGENAPQPQVNAPQAPPMQPPIQPPMQGGGPTNPSEAAMRTQVSAPMGPDPQMLAREIAATQADIGKVPDQSSKNMLLQHLADLTKQQNVLRGQAPVAPTFAPMAGSPEKAAQTQLANQSERYKKAQQALGVTKFMGGDIGGLGDVVQGMKPDYEGQRATAEQERLRNEQTRLGNEQERLGMERTRLNKPPEGYERAADGTLKAIKGGPAEAKITESEGKATTYYSQMTDARAVLEAMSKKGWDSTSTRSQIGVAIAGGVTNPLASDDAQQVRQAQEQWTEAYLRFKTGAATNSDEISRNVRTFFPQIGDKAAVVKQKEQARKDAEKAMTVSAGRGIDKLSANREATTEEVLPARTIKRSWTGKKTGKKVVEYSDGSIEYGE